MIEDIQIPDEYLGAFRRLVRRMPVEFQTEEAFLQALVMYLKLGGEKLARQRIEVERTEFETEFRLVKRQPVEVSADDKSAAGEASADDKSAAGDEDADEKDGQDGKGGKDGIAGGAGDRKDIDPDPIEP